MNDLIVPPGFEIPGWDCWEASGLVPSPMAPLLYGPCFVELPVNEAGRDFFVGDLHGQLKMLRKLLAHVAFDTTRDRLVAVGDLVDRGEHSQALLELAGRRAIYSVIGNHEAELIARNPANPGLDGAYVAQAGCEWWERLDVATKRRCRTVARSLPIALEVPLANGQRVGVVHAQVPRQDWDAAKTLTPRFGDMAPPSGGNYTDAFVALRSRAIPYGVIKQHRENVPAHVHHIDLVVTGHSNVIPGLPWRYGNQIGLESLAFLKDGALTLFAPLDGRYWQVGSAGGRQGGRESSVREIPPPVDAQYTS